MTTYFRQRIGRRRSRRRALDLIEMERFELTRAALGRAVRSLDAPLP